MSDTTKGASSQAATATLSNKDLTLTLAIIKASKVANIDWTIVAAELGLENVQAARMRWHRFKKANGIEDTVDKEKGDAAKEGESGTPKRKRGPGKGKASAVKKEVATQDGEADSVEIAVPAAKKSKK